MEFMKTLPDKHYNLAICDPPYFDGPKNRSFSTGTYYLGRKGEDRKYAKQKCYDANPDWKVPDINYYNELCRISKHQIIWGENYFNFPTGPGRLFWNKKNLKSTFSNGEIASCSLIESVRMFEYQYMGFCRADRNEPKITPTQKPRALYEWILTKFAKKGWLIFDSHVGSGSSRIACRDLGFDFIGTELNKTVYEAQEKRYIQYCITNPLA